MNKKRSIIGILFTLGAISLFLLIVLKIEDKPVANGEPPEIAAAETDIPTDPQDPETATDIEPESYLPSIIVETLVTPAPATLTPSPAPPTSTTSPPTPTETPLPPTPTATPEPPTPTPPIIVDPDAIVIDRNSVALFDQIPASYLELARNIPMMFSDRSVGENINGGLSCLASANWAASPAHCLRDYYDEDWNWKVFTQTDLDAGTVPDRIYYDADPVIYNRDNWYFVMDSGPWSWLTENFIETLAPLYINNFDALVLSYQFSYLNVNNTDITYPERGFFVDTPDHYDVHDLEAFIAQHPDRVFIFWTTSLSRGIGTQIATDFNNQMRQYAMENGKILFDVADIEAHTDLGVPCFDNRDGVQYCSWPGNCENYPDDGLDLPAICRDYTTELNGGHLGSVSAGKIQIAKAFWVLMARIAGWDGVSSE